MRVALIVTTYERPDALARVLESVARQSVAPDELLVADDGSGPATRELVTGFAKGAPFPVRHVWLAHDGFRVGRMRNRAIAATDCDFVVTVDGDMLLHPEFLADHRRAARPGHYQQGCRVLLDGTATLHALASGEMPRWTSRGLGLRRRLYALHSPTASRWFGGIANGLLAIKSCNQGYWRSDRPRGQRVRRVARWLGVGRQGTLRAARERGPQPPLDPLRRHRVITCTIRRPIVPHMPAIPLRSRRRGRVAEPGAITA